MPTQLGTAQLKDECVTQQKLNDNALRPVDGGALSGTELTFGPEYRKKYSLSVTTNIELSLAASGNMADSWIYITATGDGVHDLDFPAEWRIKSGAFNPDVVQRIELYYDGTYVYVDIISIADVITATLTAAEVLGSQPTLLNLVFNSAVNITNLGWTLISDGGAVNIGSVSGSGTATPVFTLDREIEPGETVTLSYNPLVGNTTSISGTEIVSISAFAVVTEPEEPEDPAYTITVGPSGRDYTTWTAANAAAVAGDIIGGYSGTYRESFVAKSGVRYEGAPGETVIINGCDLIGTSGWTAHDLSGGKAIYKKTITLPVTGFNQTISSNTTIAANQIFKDGDMQIQAQWPKIVNKDDLFDIYKLRHHSAGTNLINATFGRAFQSSSITDASAAVGTLGTLTGGTIFITGWYQSATRVLNSHSGSVLGFPAYQNAASGNIANNFRKWWKVTNQLEVLTAAKEWHYEGGILYYWQTGGGSPSGTLEYKARNWGIDLSDRTDVVIKNITFFGCEVRGNTGTHRCTLDGIKGFYTNHVVMCENNWERVNMEQTGFRLIGNDNTVTNSEFDWGASQCIWLGNNGKAINNLIKHYGYEGNYGCGVAFWGNTNGQLVTRNTIHAMGRSCIDGSMTWSGSNQNIEISYNDMYDYCKINNDGGAIYFARWTNTAGLNVHHNWIHDDGAKPDPQGFRLEGILAAIYMDQGTGPGTFHHNVLWNNWTTMPIVGPGAGAGPGGTSAQDAADFYILSINGGRTSNTATHLYNNIFESSVGGAKYSYITYITSPQDIQKNNIYNGGIIVNWGGNPTTGAPPGGTTLVSNSILQNQTPVYLGTGTGGLIYRPASGSALQVNAGTPVAGITDGYQGANPDAGAYEWGDPDPWVPGYGAVVGGSETFVDATPANVTYSGTWSLPQASQSGWFGGTISYSNVPGSTATFTRSATRIKIYAERMATHGTGTVTLDGGSPVSVSFNTAPLGLQVLIWDSGVISAGSHTVVLTVTSGFCLFDFYTFL